MKEVKFTIPLAPRTKKNSQRLIRTKNGRIIPIPSKAYENYEKQAGWFLKPLKISTAVNVKCLFYMDTHRIVDLPNLEEAIDDIMVKYEVVVDDNSRIIASHDGSRVRYDKENPRTEIVITEFKD